MASAGPRVIGLLGGMSWESSAEYYRLVNELVRARLGGLHSARCLLASVDFAEVENLQVSGDWATAGELLAEAARGLEAAGAALLLLCTNTMHKVADQVQRAVTIPLLHLADVAADAVTAAGLSTVGLLGTAFTMEQDFYRDRLESHGLTVLIPDAADRAEVHRIIYDELCLGVVSEESRRLYRGVIDRLVRAGAQGVVLGCTEIELLVSAADSPVPVFPTTRLHAEAAVEAALAPRGTEAAGRTSAELAVALVEAFGAPDAIGELLTDDAEWWITPTVGVLGSPTVGRDRILESMRVIFGELYADAEVEVHMSIGDGELAAARITLRATALFAGGQPYENEYSLWIRRRGDRISRVWEYLDVAQVGAQFS